MSNPSSAPQTRSVLRMLGIFVVLCLSGCAHHSTGPAPTAPAGVAPPTASAAVFQIDESLRAASALPTTAFEGEGWRELFNGQNLEGWRLTRFSGQGAVECKHGLVVLGMGEPFTGVTFTNELPRINYEVALDAMRVMGSDFFCGLTVPVGESFCSLIVGGWGGVITGISILDGMDASENETMKFMQFEPRRWYRIRLRVTSGRLEAWIDDDRIINVGTVGKRIALRPGEIELAKPFGICSWQTSGAFRQVKLRPVTGRAMSRAIPLPTP